MAKPTEQQADVQQSKDRVFCIQIAEAERLSVIANDLLGDPELWEGLRVYNGLAGDHIDKGAILKVPLDILYLLRRAPVPSVPEAPKKPKSTQYPESVLGESMRENSLKTPQIMPKKKWYHGQLAFTVKMSSKASGSGPTKWEYPSGVVKSINLYGDVEFTWSVGDSSAVSFTPVLLDIGPDNVKLTNRARLSGTGSDLGKLVKSTAVRDSLTDFAYNFLERVCETIGDKVIFSFTPAIEKEFSQKNGKLGAKVSFKPDLAIQVNITDLLSDSMKDMLSVYKNSIKENMTVWAKLESAPIEFAFTAKGFELVSKVRIGITVREKFAFKYGTTNHSLTIAQSGTIEFTLRPDEVARRIRELIRTPSPSPSPTPSPTPSPAPKKDIDVRVVVVSSSIVMLFVAMFYQGKLGSLKLLKAATAAGALGTATGAFADDGRNGKNSSPFRRPTAYPGEIVKPKSGGKK
jgi:hypothetical protein